MEQALATVYAAAYAAERDRGVAHGNAQKMAAIATKGFVEFYRSITTIQAFPGVNIR